MPLEKECTPHMIIMESLWKRAQLFYQDRGKPLYLGKGYKGILWSIIGDHDLFSNVVFPPHWSSHHPCWECDAENFEGANPWKRYKEISLEKLNLGVYSHQEQLDNWMTLGLTMQSLDCLMSAHAWSEATPCTFSFARGCRGCTPS